MNSVGVIGLGLIGGSMARAASSRAGCKVYGYDADAEVVAAAIREGVLAGKLEDHYEDIELLIVALYPPDVVDIISQVASKLSKECIVIDCTGVKKIICTQLSGKLPNNIRFIGGHPMAGKEVAGYTNSCDDMFDGASMILCRDEYTDDEALKAACGFFPKLGFAQVKVTTWEEHDSVIAYTSQLAHIVSSAYIKSPTLDKRYGFSAGSFKDMTRVAKLNEDMWADLFLANSDALLFEINEITGHLDEYARAVKEGDRDALVRLLREGRVRKENDTDREVALKEKKDPWISD